MQTSFADTMTGLICQEEEEEEEEEEVEEEEEEVEEEEEKEAEAEYEKEDKKKNPRWKMSTMIGEFVENFAMAHRTRTVQQLNRQRKLRRMPAANTNHPVNYHHHDVGDTFLDDLIEINLTEITLT